MKKEIETFCFAAIFLAFFVAIASLGINITAAQINWSSVTFSLGFIVGAVLMIFYLRRQAFIRALKKIVSKFKR